MYPIMGDPSLASMPASTGTGGIIGDLSSMANQLGAGQAIDLLKGMVMPAIMSAVKPAAARRAVAVRPGGEPQPPPRPQHGGHPALAHRTCHLTAPQKPFTLGSAVPLR